MTFKFRVNLKLLRLLYYTGSLPVSSLRCASDTGNLHWQRTILKLNLPIHQVGDSNLNTKATSTGPGSLQLSGARIARAIHTRNKTLDYRDGD